MNKKKLKKKVKRKVATIKSLFKKKTSKKHFPKMVDDPKPEAELYTVDELATRLNMTRKFVEKQQHRIPGRIKIGRSVRFIKLSVEKALIFREQFLNPP